ncbi:MAG: hypothetical protein P4K98_09995 [Bryobacteraceae bacterium]|nr:hypothetical protein [Bryobacteraceae bacterium]
MKLACLARILPIALLAGLGASGQTNPPVYPFSFDQDNLQGAPDFSFLNHPLTQADRVFVKDGHFYTVGRDHRPNTPDDQRVRFFGVSFAFGANFPDPALGDPQRIAKRLRRLGINLVRLHHMDSEPDPVGDTSEFNSTLTTGPYPSFNDNGLKRLRAFLTALSNEGVYVDLNLHVGYTFRPAVDQVPSLPGGMPDQSKPLQAIYPRMIELQQQYAQGLINKLQLQGDPVLAMVEISNENSVISSWQGGQLDPVLVGDYRTALQSEWNTWLAAKYQNSATLAQSWGANTADGPNLLPGIWKLEADSPAVASMTASTSDGLPTEQVHVSRNGNYVFIKQTGFSLTSGNHYRWTFQARADLAAGATVSVPVSVMRDNSPWDGYSVAPYSITLTNQWQTFTVLATASFDILVNPPNQSDGARVALEVDNVSADVYVRGASLVQAGVNGLASGQSIEQANLTLPGPTDNPTAARLNDYAAFLTSVDQHYVNTLRDSVRAVSDQLVPITGTQVGYGGLSIFDSQDGLDYQDNHFYIDHPNFPTLAWDPWDWRIQDQAAADDTWSSFVDMAWGREAGKPYTVSEYNQPWPNRHGTEIDPSLAAFAAFQDWDAIMHFDYAGGRGWDGAVPSAFDLNGDVTKFPLIGQSAWLFRSAAVHSSAATLSVPVSAAQRLQSTVAVQSPSTWVNTGLGLPKQAALTRGVQLAKDSTVTLPEGATGAVNAPYVSDTGELSFDPNAKLFLLNAPQAAGVSGAIGNGGTSTSGPIDVKLGTTGSGFATVLVSALDHAAIPHSGRLLISVPGYGLRSLPAPGEQRPAAASSTPQWLVNYQNDPSWWTIDPTNSNPTWGTWAGRTPPSGNMSSGYSPTYMTRVECWVTVRTQATAPTVEVLDGAGKVAATLPASEIQPVTGGYQIHLNGTGQAMSPWFVFSATAPAAPSISASPNPIPVTAGSSAGQTTLAWNAPGYDAVEVHQNAPGGPLIASSGSSGTFTTGAWVTNGMRFYLVDAATHTELAVLTVTLRARHIRAKAP